MNEYSGLMPEFRLREGRVVDEILGLISEEASIRILILGASPDAAGPGPLVSRLAGQMSGSMQVPVTVVPGNMTVEQIDDLA